MLIMVVGGSYMWSELTVLGGLVDTSHSAVGQNLEMVANPNAAVEQLLLDPFSDWMRTRTCFTKR